MEGLRRLDRFTHALGVLMAHARLWGWVLTGLLLSLQGAFFYALARYVALGRFRFNPFQKGWNYLVPRYGTPTGPLLPELVRLTLGSTGYSMYLSFAETGLYLQPNGWATGWLHIPYAAFHVVHLPERVTILKYPLTRAGLFTIDQCVELSLDEESARKLLAKMALGGAAAPASQAARGQGAVGQTGPQ